MDAFSVDGLVYPRMPRTNSSAPAEAAAPSAAEPPKTSFEEVCEELLLSPPVFVAWALGYITTPVMTVCILLMLMPLGTKKVVDNFGGRGAWAPKPGQAPTKLQRLFQAFHIKGQYFLPPLVMMFYFRKDNDDLAFVGTLVSGYVGLVAVNLVSGGQLAA